MKQRSYFCTALVLLLVLCAVAGQDSPAPQITSLPSGGTTIAEVKGELRLYGPQGALLSAHRGEVLGPGSTIETENGSILLLLQDGSQVLVKSHTRVVLKEPNRDNGYYLELLIGKVINKIQKRLGSNPSFRMGTPTAVITVRGTRFEVEVNKKLRTSVVVYEGLVEVAGLGGGSPPVLLRPGFFTTVGSDRGPQQPREVGEFGDREGFQSGRENEGFGQGGEREGQQSGQRPERQDRSGPDN